MTILEPAPSIHLRHGDCLDVIHEYQDGYFQLALTSTPYPGLKGFDLTVDEYFAWWVARFQLIMQKLDPRTGVFVQVVKFKRRTNFYSPHWRTSDTDSSFFDSRIFNLVKMYETLGMGCIDVHIWDKLNAPPSGNHERHDRDEYEFCFAMARSPHYVKNEVRAPYSKKTVGKSKPGNKARSTDVSGSLAGGHSRLHPEGALVSNMVRASSSGDGKRPRAKGGSFPTAVARRFILEYSNPDDWVLDPCVGVGTSLLEAARNGRHSVGIDTELSELWQAEEWLRDDGPYHIQTFWD